MRLCLTRASERTARTSQVRKRALQSTPRRAAECNRHRLRHSPQFPNNDDRVSTATFADALLINKSRLDLTDATSMLIVLS
jgi:hypothetical protein